jgi:hypothetical protein
MGVKILFLNKGETKTEGFWDLSVKKEITGGSNYTGRSVTIYNFTIYFHGD